MENIETIRLFPMVFWDAERQTGTIEGDVFIEEDRWDNLIEQDNRVTEEMLFEKPTMELTKHLKLLCIKAHINGKPFNRVFVDGVVVLNIMPLATTV